MALENLLKKLAFMQKKRAVLIFVLALILTAFLGIGLSKIRLETDMKKMMPQELPIFKSLDRVSEKFGGQDMVLLVIQLDKDSEVKEAPKDIRDPLIIRYLIFLEDSIKKESSVSSVNSVAYVFRRKMFFTLDHVKAILAQNPSANNFFNDDYSTTLMYISSNLGTSEEKVKVMNKLINKKLSSVPTIPGLKISITGNPPMRVTILDLLVHDSIFTLLIAAIIILGLLVVMKRSFTKALLVFIPLTIGLTWMFGTMGWLNIPLSIATVGIGAMILGLGVEYGIFLVSRYEEERNKDKTQLESLQTSVSGVGKAIFGSATTTIVGFSALSLSSMPMIRNLGLTLATGIFYCLAVALLVNPCIIILEENMEKWLTARKHVKYSKKMILHRRKTW